MSRRHEAHVHHLHIALYGVVVVAVGVVGAVAIWFFIERQSLVIRPETLPKVTLVTRDADSQLAASWVRLLTQAGLSATLVAVDDVDRIEGVLVFCDVDVVPPELARLSTAVPALVFIGAPPSGLLDVDLAFDSGESGGVLRLGDAPSPLLARIRPGATIRSASRRVALLQETPRMIIDGRWSENARAAIMHMETAQRRIVWFGIDAGAVRPSGELLLLLRSAFRWTAGQPMSDGAVGAPQTAKALASVARLDAREKGFTFSVDRATRQGVLTVRMINRADVPLPNPTLKIWLPRGVKRVALGGDFIMRRGATLTAASEEGTCLLSLPTLARHETRMLKLVIPPSGNTER